jgi:hypothetical protein
VVVVGVVVVVAARVNDERVSYGEPEKQRQLGRLRSRWDDIYKDKQSGSGTNSSDSR